MAAMASMTTSSEDDEVHDHAAPPRRRLAPSRRSTTTGASSNGGTTTTTTTAVTPSGRIVVLPSAGSSRPASRSGSPARRQLRSLPSVPAVSNLEVHSDKLVRLEEDLAFINDQLLQQQQRQQQRRATGDQEEAGANGAAIEEDTGKAKELALPSTRPVATVTYAEEPLIQAGISDYTFIPLDAGGLLGKGKFSSVQLAWKNGQKFAVKITPLYPHHTLIATRLLREPTILAQLPLHPNLVRVYESIRTPAYFYLVEEFLDGYTSLESFVASQPNSRLSLDAATHVFKQLVSVVRSGLHQPIQIAHRDIKPENILIHPETLHITLLDFGLATHFSWRQPKLTTCCGSPAFHAPELYLSLKSPPGSVRYWGPEIDIWTIGVTLLRCLTGTRYPLGVSHTSLQHMADKTVDSLLSIPHAEFRRTLAGLLDMDGDKRIAFFAALPAEIDEYPHTLDTKHIHVTNFDGPAHALGSAAAAAASTSATSDKDKEAGDGRDFKNTTFIQTQPKHSLQMPLISPPQSPAMSPNASASALAALTAPLAGPAPTTPGAGTHALLASPRSRSQSRDRLAAHFAAGLDLSLHELPSAGSAAPAAAGTASASSNGGGAGAPTPVALAHQQFFTSPAGPKQPRPPSSRTASTYDPHASALAIAASQELLLLNPSGEPAKRAISFVKYALRCAGILYHVQPHPPVRPASAWQTQSQSQSQSQSQPQPQSGSRPGTSSGDAATAVGEDLPSAEAPRMHLCAPVLHCIQVLPKERVHPSSAAATLLTSQLRPALSRSQTAGPSSSASTRSPSAPPGSTAAKRKAEAAAAAAKLRVLEFWIQIVPVYAVVRHSPVAERKALASINEGGATGGSKRRGTSRSRGRDLEERRCSKLRIRVSDEAAVPFLVKALGVGKLSEEESATEPETQAQTQASAAIKQKAGSASRKKGVAFAGVERAADARAASEDDAADDEGRGRSKLSRSPQASGLVAASSAKESASGLDTVIKEAARPTITRAMTEASAVLGAQQPPMASPARSPLSTPQALSSGSVSGKDASSTAPSSNGRPQKQRRGPAQVQRQQSVSSPSTGGSSASVLTGSSGSASKRGFFDIVTSSFGNGGSRPRRIASAEPPYSNLNSPCITESPAESMPNTPNAVAFTAL